MLPAGLLRALRVVVGSRAEERAPIDCMPPPPPPPPTQFDHFATRRHDGNIVHRELLYRHSSIKTAVLKSLIEKKPLPTKIQIIKIIMHKWAASSACEGPIRRRITISSGRGEEGGTRYFKMIMNYYNQWLSRFQSQSLGGRFVRFILYHSTRRNSFSWKACFFCFYFF